VLVAEDDPVSQVVARELLQRQGARVTLVANGEEAVAAAAGGGFDLVLMDIRMPGLDGLRACRRIRALPGWDRPIVALTANALSSERERCLAAGMAGYLTKPLEPSTFYAEVCRSLGRPGGAAGEGGGDGCGDGFGEAPGPDSGGAPAAPVGFDGAKLRHWLEDLPEVWGPIVRAFRADYPGAMAAIRAALDADDRAVAGDLLHRLRGSAGALGARGLSEAAGYLELALSSPGPVDAALAADLFAQAEAALTALAGLESPAPGAQPTEVAPPGPDECRQRLRELEALLEAGNTRAPGYAPWVEGCLCSEYPAAVQALLAQLEALDFPAALKTLRDIGSSTAGAGEPGPKRVGQVDM
jgi:two-component system sensor histidine kinase/response regulator